MFDLGRNRDNHFAEKSEQFIVYENHQRLKVLEEKYDLKNNYIFTFVRHPYTRIKSWYYYHKSAEPYNSQSLNEWISNGCETHWKRQNKTNWKNENLSPLLQYNFIDGDSKINYVGKIENFEEDCKNIISELNEIFEQNDCPKRLEYRKLNRNSSSKRNNDDITKENKDLIYDMFRKDFEYFNYER